MLKSFVPHLNSTGEGRGITNARVCRKDGSFQLAETEFTKVTGLFASLK